MKDKSRPQENRDPRERDIAFPSRTKEILDQYQFHFKKSLGQNFLIDPNILRKITESADLGKNDGVIEIGPGIGSLTEHLARAAGKVVAIEIDRRLQPILEETLSDYENVSFVWGDVLQLDLQQLIKQHFAETESVHVVANLPYYVTTPILMKLLEDRLPLKSIVVMMQKEVADRIAASEGSKDYGSLSIAAQYYAIPEKAMRVPHSVFIPRPHVDSMVLKLTLRENPPVDLRDEELFFKVVRAGFAQRRKTLYNNLSKQITLNLPFEAERDNAREAGKSKWLDIFSEAGIDPGRRAESLSIEEWARLSNVVFRTGIK